MTSKCLFGNRSPFFLIIYLLYWQYIYARNYSVCITHLVYSTDDDYVSVCSLETYTNKRLIGYSHFYYRMFTPRSYVLWHTKILKIHLIDKEHITMIWCVFSTYKWMYMMMVWKNTPIKTAFVWGRKGFVLSIFD